MSGSRLVLPVQQPVTSAGLPYAGGSLYFYVTGTNTLTPTYSDVGLTVPNANPITLDSAGEFGNVFLPQNVVYKIVLFDANGNQIWSYDPVYALAPVSSSGLIWCGNSSGTANSQTVTATGFSAVDGATLIFIASYTNTSALTVNPNSTSNYNVYKDSDAGPVALTGSEIIASSLVELTYSSTLGGFHILNNRANNNAFTNLASSATTDLGSVGNHNLTITGTTGITGFGSSAFVGNPLYNLVFTGSLTITNSASLALPGGVNQTTQAGDFAIAKYLGSGNWQVINYSPATGLPSVNPLPSSSGKVGYLLEANNSSGYGDWSNASVVRARASFSTGATPTIDTGAINIASITHNSTGNYTVAFTNNLASANYQVLGMAAGSGFIVQVPKASKTISGFVFTTNSTSGLAEFTNADIAVYGGW